MTDWNKFNPEVKKIIEKGNLVEADKEKSEFTLISLQISRETLAAIDKKAKRPKMARSAWIRQAIENELKRE